MPAVGMVSPRPYLISRLLVQNLVRIGIDMIK